MKDHLSPGPIASTTHLIFMNESQYLKVTTLFEVKHWERVQWWIVIYTPIDIAYNII